MFVNFIEEKICINLDQVFQMRVHGQGILFDTADEYTCETIAFDERKHAEKAYDFIMQYLYSNARFITVSTAGAKMGEDLE